MGEIKVFKKLWFWLLLLSLSLWLAVSSLPRQEELKLVFCDVGQGDAALLSRGSLQILIDGGPDKKVLECLGRNLPFWDKTIEMVVSTHGEKDHLGGLISVLESYRVLYFVTDGLAVDSNYFREFRRLVLENEVKIIEPKIGQKLEVENLSFEVLWPSCAKASEDKPSKESSIWQSNRVLGVSDFAKEPNERSLVLKFKFKRVQAMFTGDISSKTEEKIDFSSAEILKISHHGSKYSTSDFLLGEVNPKLAVICVGKNHFGHPTEEVLSKLKSRGIEIWRTDTQGELVLRTLGQNWTY